MEITQNVTGLDLQPAFLADNVPLVFSTDDYYVPVLGVLLKSICDTKSDHKNYDLLVLHEGIAPWRISLLLSVVQGYNGISLRFVDVGAYVHKEIFFTANRPEFSKNVYFRLLIPDLFVCYEKMLYLDCDMIAVQDISKLFHIDMGDCYIGAVTSLLNYQVASEDYKALDAASLSSQLLQAYKTDSYINSGLVLFNLEQIRKDLNPGVLWRTALEMPWQGHDEDVLNHVFFGRIHHLHARWNFTDVIFLSHLFASFPRKVQDEMNQAKDSPGVIHFIFFTRKPWQNVTHYSIAYFWPIAIRTPFYSELLRRQLKFAEDIVVVKSEKRVDDKMSEQIQEGHPQYNIYNITQYELNLSQQRLILQSMLQNKELEYRLLGKNEGYSRRQLALLAKTDGNINKIKRVTPKRILAFEFSICGNCNLNCKGCAHFAPLVKDEYADFETSDRAFERLGQLFNGEAEYIHLLGGEPLLHPRLTDFVQSVRKYFPVGKIELVTNGLLLPKMDDTFWTKCRENKIQISVTRYPVSFDYITVQALAAYHGVNFEYFMNTDLLRVKFNNISLDLTGTQNPDDNFLNCHVANLCITLKNGRIYPCSIAPNLPYFAQRFGDLEFSKKDSIDIFTAKDKDEILEFASSPNPLCRYCSPKNQVPFDEWGISKYEKEEWTL